GTALDRTEWYLGLPLSPEYVQSLGTRYLDLAAGYRAADERRRTNFNIYRGWIGEPLPLELIPGLTRPTSASRLEALTACPYRFFLRDVLGVRPPDDPEDDPSQWITRMESGSLVHEVCHQFMLLLRGRGERPNLEKHLPILRDLVDRAIAAKVEEVPVHNEAAYKAEVARLHRAAKVFLSDESRRECEPHAF